MHAWDGREEKAKWMTKKPTWTLTLAAARGQEARMALEATSTCVANVLSGERAGDRRRSSQSRRLSACALLAKAESHTAANLLVDSSTRRTKPESTHREL